MRAASLSEIVRVLERRFPPHTAEPWDAVGLVAGDPAQEVRRVLLAVDPVAATVREAIDWGADLLLTHHPLYLRGVTSVAATTAKGQLVHSLIRAGGALYAAHTNADAARGGVAECLARAVGLEHSRPIVPLPSEALDVVVTYVPVSDAARVIDALSDAGAGSIGNYAKCAWVTDGLGQFLPGAGASPTVGRVGEVTRVAERRIEMVLPRTRRDGVVDALRASHPYEEPAFSLLPMGPTATAAGLGRIGELPAATTFGEFAQRVAVALPATAHGLRISGDLQAPVRTVAVCGGSGDSLLEQVRGLRADVYVTSDLRHHRALEARAEGGDGRPFLVDVAHWAGEWPWLVQAAGDLVADMSAAGATVETRVSTLVTDPWTAHLESAAAAPNPTRSPGGPS